MADFFLYGIKNVFVRIKKTGFSIVSIAIGTFAFVVIFMAGDLGTGYIGEQLSNLGFDCVAVYSDSSMMTAGLTKDDLNFIKKSEDVECVSPVRVSYIQIQSKNPVEAVAWGIDDSFETIMSFSFSNGRMFTKNEVVGKEKVCIVTSTFAKQFFGRENVVGKTLAIKMNTETVDLRIIGVTQGGIGAVQNLLSQFFPTMIYVPETLVSDGLSPKYTQIAIKPKENAVIDMETIVDQLYLQNGTTCSYQNMSEQLQLVKFVLNIVATLLSGIAFISLFVAGFGIMTTMYSGVRERKREIGIKKSVGASGWRLMMDFLWESIFISLCGCAIGLLLAILCIWGVCAKFLVPFHFDLLFIVQCLACGTALGGLFGLLPAIRAAKLSPVEACKWEE